jgi:hypothetical protein
MKYLVHLTDSSGEHTVLITLSEEEVQKTAVDVVFDIIGCDKPEELVKEGVVSEAQLEDLKIFQRLIFARDDQGLFIRDGIEFKANGKDLNPDVAFNEVFVPAESEGLKYLRCELAISAPEAIPVVTSVKSKSSSDIATAQKESQEQQMKAFARIMFLHQIALGSTIDVTKDHPEIDEVIAWAEREELIEIDVQKAAYRLTAKGKALYEGYVQEAQDLIKKFDIYGDVDLDSSGTVRFDTGLGNDLRVALFELNGVDPFRARFLIGLSDGEWDQLSNWQEVIQDVSWYERMFEQIEQAPSVDDIGRDTLLHIQDEGKAMLRRELR